MLQKLKDIKMSQEKKILFLVLSLIILMVFCVYTHLPDFMKEQDNSITPEAVKTETVEKVEEKIVEEPKIEEKVEESSTEVIEEVVVEKVEEEPVVEEVVVEEIPAIPLITTDKRYNRKDNQKNIEELSRTTQELQIKMNGFIKENPIVFKKDGFKVTNRSDITVKKVAEALNEFPNIKIEVAGHTDASGGSDVNDIFSSERAKSVRDRLVEYGIASERIEVRGYGEQMPLPGINGYSKENRRVEFNIVEE